MQRTTPLSFTRPHIGAAFSMTGGVLNIVAPKQPLDGEVATVQNIMVEVCATHLFCHIQVPWSLA